jgi:hypothetical protein
MLPIWEVLVVYLSSVWLVFFGIAIVRQMVRWIAASAERKREKRRQQIEEENKQRILHEMALLFWKE